jgi:hypothetical protein
MLTAVVSGEARARTAVLLGLLVLLVYNANLREVSSQDTMPARLLPVALIQEGSLTLDMFFRDHPPGAPLPYWVQRANGHYVSGYPLLPALLALPVYLVPIRLLGGDSWALISVLAKLTASSIAALSVVLVYLALARLQRDSVALAIAMVYALGTSTWSVSSQGLWGHGAAQLFMAAAILCALAGDDRPVLLDAVGPATGLMVAARSITALLAAALLAYVIMRHPRRGLRAVAFFAAVLLPFVAYNLWTFGTVEGGYTRLHEDFKADGFAGTWVTPLGEGLPGLLVSPSRGLFVYSPVLVFAVAGLVLSLRQPRRRLFFGCLAAGLAASLLTLAKYSLWFGGASFGPRLLTDFLPALTMFLAPVGAALERHRTLRVAATLLFAVSIGVQVVGVFYYPSPREVDWNSAPRDVPVRARVWDWKDSQIARLLRNGPRPLGFGPLE